MWSNARRPLIKCVYSLPLHLTKHYYILAELCGLRFIKKLFGDFE